MRVVDRPTPHHNVEMIEPAGTALIAVDAQLDFIPGGALGVPGADVVVAPIRELATYVGVVVATRDFHPPSHCGFTAQGGPWPPHCVIATPGAALHPGIDAIAHVIVSKGTGPSLEQYSGFDGTGLAALLQARGVRQLIVAGIATDYCVRGHSACSVRRGLRDDRCARRGARGGPSSRRRRSSPG